MSNGWHHYAFTVDRSQVGAARAELYIDGVVVGNNLQTGNNEDPPFLNAIFFIGSRNNSAFKYSGLIDELRISDQVLSPSQFLNAIPEPSTALLLVAGGLLALWRQGKR